MKLLKNFQLFFFGDLPRSRSRRTGWARSTPRPSAHSAKSASSLLTSRGGC